MDKQLGVREYKFIVHVLSDIGKYFHNVFVHILFSILVFMAERGGFEPPVPFSITGFQDQRLKPLGHLSSFCNKPSGGRLCLPSCVVPLTGVEPVRKPTRKILSLLCLPIPPQRQTSRHTAASFKHAYCNGATRRTRTFKHAGYKSAVLPVELWWRN